MKISGWVAATRRARGEEEHRFARNPESRISRSAEEAFLAVLQSLAQQPSACAQHAACAELNQSDRVVDWRSRELKRMNQESVGKKARGACHCGTDNVTNENTQRNKKDSHSWLPSIGQS
jgi:hypothetical protein